MIRADFHIHSTVSDGSDSIEEIVKAAEEKGLNYISITDHDTVSHFSQIPQNTKVKVIRGVELSAVDKNNGMRAHILGYNIERPEIISKLTQHILEARNNNSEKQVEILKSYGFHIDMDKLQRADGKYLYKQHIMDYLVSTKQVAEMFGLFYRSVFKNNGVCAFDIDYLDAVEAVKMIKLAGGQAVLAHSGQQQNFYLIPSLTAAGLDGLEINHHANSEKDRKTIQEYAQDYELFLTGGSDYHGRYEPQPFGIGDFLSEESGVKAVCRI